MAINTEMMTGNMQWETAIVYLDNKSRLKSIFPQWKRIFIVAVAI